MATVTIKRNVNFKDIEALNDIVINKPEVTLRLPNSLSTSGIFGIEGLVLQLIATWLRKEGEHIFHTFINDPSDAEQFSDLCNTLYGICALTLSDEILSSSKEKVDRELSLLTANDRLNKVRKEDFRDSFKGFYLTIPSIKAPKNNNEYLNPFYNKDTIVSRNKFLQVTKDALNTVTFNERKQLSEQVISNISGIIRELFTNTHKHARKDEKGNILEKNFRAVSFRTASINKVRLDKLSESGGFDLTLFIAQWKPKDNKTIPMLDITVVDSGPGYARRWTGLAREELSFEDECNAIVSCFKKYNSSDNFESSGSGLSNVLRDLKSLRGWFRLRTGSAKVERSFFNQQGETSISISDINNMDMFVDGVVFNIVIPLKEF